MVGPVEGLRIGRTNRTMNRIWRQKHQKRIERVRRRRIEAQKAEEKHPEEEKEGEEEEEEEEGEKEGEGEGADSRGKVEDGGELAASIVAQPPAETPVANEQERLREESPPPPPPPQQQEQATAASQDPLQQDPPPTSPKNALLLLDIAHLPAELLLTPPPSAAGTRGSAERLAAVVLTKPLTEPAACSPARKRKRTGSPKVVAEARAAAKAGPEAGPEAGAEAETLAKQRDREEMAPQTPVKRKSRAAEGRGEAYETRSSARKRQQQQCSADAPPASPCELRTSTREANVLENPGPEKSPAEAGVSPRAIEARVDVAVGATPPPKRRTSSRLAGTASPCFPTPTPSGDGPIAKRTGRSRRGSIVSPYFSEAAAASEKKGCAPNGVRVMSWPSLSSEHFGLVQEELQDNPVGQTQPRHPATGS